MSFNGSGSFLINTAGQPVVSGTVISSTAFNALTADLATGLSTCITKDGQTTVTANIPMANYKFTGLGAGSGAADSANLSQVQSTVVKLLASVSGTDTITAVGSPTVAAYAAGQMFYFVAAGDNTGAVTINIDSLGAKAVTRDGSVALVAGDIKSGEVVVIVYDGTRFQVVSQLNSSGDARFANVSIASALNVGGVATFSAGTAAAPAITTTGDTNTGIFFPAADTIAFAEGGAEALRIDSSANVGIGTSSPTAKLTISGNQSFPEKTAAYLGVDVATSSGNGGNLTVKAGCGSGVGNSSGNLFLASGRGNSNASNGYIAFGISQATNAVGLDAEYMRLDASGNLGLGVTPDGNNLAKVFQLEQGFTMFGFSNTSYLSANAYYNSGWKYKSTAAAAYYEMSGANGHKWNIAASGTINTAISFTTAMTLDASGNLGVGTTSPSARLDVRSAIGTSVDGSQNINLIDTTSYALGNGGGVSLGYVYNSGGDVIGRAAVIKGIKENATNGNYASALTFSTTANSASTTEKARITSGGSLLVGSTADNGYHRLNRSNTSDWICAFANTSATTPWGLTLNYSAAAPNNTSAAFTFADNAAERATIRNNGGLANYQANDVNLSDQRVKKDIKPLGSMWDKFKAIEIVTFKYKDQTHDDDNIGVIAQQVESVAPEFIDVDGFGETPEDGVPLKTVYTTDMYHAAIKALQEAMARIEKLEAEVAALKGA